MLYFERKIAYNSLMYDFVLFDLDGTIVNSQRGIAYSLQHVFDKYGVEFSGDIRIFIGPPFVQSFPKYLGTDEKLTDLLIREYREIYNEVGVYQTTMFRGISDLLASLKQSGKTVALATTKPRYFAQIILKQKRIFRYFDFVSGTEFDGTLTDKVDVLKNAFAHVDIPREKSVLIGDTIYDCLGAKEVGLDCIGVTYGYGKKQDLLNCNAKLTVDSVKELKSVLLR